MAARDGSLQVLGNIGSSTLAGKKDPRGGSIMLSDRVATTYYRMQGYDVDNVPVIARCWTVSGTHDITGAKSGVSSFSNISILLSWTV